MFCPNCGVKLNKLDKCEICGVDLQVLQKFNLVKETPPQNNYSNISSFARSLKSRRMNVDKFLEEQKEFLKANAGTLKRTGDASENVQSVDNQTRYNFNSANRQVRSIFGNENAQVDQNNVQIPSGGMRNVANEQPQATATHSQPQPQNQPVQHQTQVQQVVQNQANVQPVDNSLYINEGDIIKDEFDIPKINGEGTSHQAGVQNNPQANPQILQNNVQANPFNNQNNFQPNANQGFAEIQQSNNQNVSQLPQQVGPDEFNIPVLNNELPNNPQLQSEQVINQADKLSQENNKKLKEIKSTQKKRKGCSVFALTLAILTGVAIALFAILENVKINVEFITVVHKFILTNQNYYIWGVLGAGVLALLFMIIGLMVGRTNFKWIAMLLVMFLIGAVVYYLYSTNLLIPSINNLIELFKK